MIRGNTVSETVLITGATGLVGAPTVSRFAADGWQVVGTAHRRSPKDVPTGVRIRPTDLSDQTDVERLVSEVAPAVNVSPGRLRSAADSRSCRATRNRRRQPEREYGEAWLAFCRPLLLDVPRARV